MKLRIAICDDETAETEYLTTLAREWATAGKVSADIVPYDSAEAFLFAYDADKAFDILLLDIQMKSMDGVTLAKHLRAGGGQMQIIFITGLPDFIAEGYDVSALHYLMKPVGKERLFAVLDKAVGLLAKTDASVLVETENGQTRIFHRDIHCAEAFAHTTVLQTKAGDVEAKLSIGELEIMLGETFCRAHRSYLVGLRHIRQITKTDVVMDSGKVIPLARRRYTAINQAFIRYYKGAT